jgi:hypothetical protein
MTEKFIEQVKKSPQLTMQSYEFLSKANMNTASETGSGEHKIL